MEEEIMIMIKQDGMNKIRLKDYFLLFLIFLINSCAFSKNSFKGYEGNIENRNTSSIILPIYEVKDSSILDIMKLTSCYSDKLFGRNNNSLWVLDFIVKKDTVFYRFRVMDWHNLLEDQTWKEENIGLGFCYYGKNLILIEEPAIYFDTEVDFHYLVNDIFIKTERGESYLPKTKGKIDFIVVDFYKTRKGFELWEAIQTKDGKTKKLPICK